MRSSDEKDGKTLGLQSNWERFLNEFWEKCHATYRQRGQQYNRNTEIRSYWIYGLRSIFHAIWGKTNRVKSIISDQSGPIGGGDLEAFEDNLIDLAVYAAFAYAENRCRMAEFEAPLLRQRMEEHKEITNAIDAVCKTSECDLGPISDHVERVVLESRPPVTNQASDHPYNILHVGACPSCTEYDQRSGPDIGGGRVDVGFKGHPEEHAGTDSEDT